MPTTFDGYECQGWTFSPESLSQMSMWGPPLVDSEDPEKTIDGALALDISVISDNEFIDEQGVLAANAEDKAQIVVAMLIANQLHEIAEWLRLGGDRIFKVHRSDEEEWDAIGRIAWQAAGRMLAEHPR